MSDVSQLPVETKPAHRPALPFEQRIPRDYQDAVLAYLARGMSLHKATNAAGNRYCVAALYAWAEENEDFRERFARARRLGRRAKADMRQDIADDCEAVDDHGRPNMAAVKKAELRIGSINWELERLEPETYSPRQRVDHSHTHRHELGPDTQARLDRILDRIAANRAPLLEAAPVVQSDAEQAEHGSHSGTSDDDDASG